MAHSISSGEKLHDTATGAVLNNALIVKGAKAFVALSAATTGDGYTLASRGVFTLTKKAAANTEWAIGERVYYIATGGVNKLTGVAAAGTLIGWGWSAAVTGDTTGTVFLSDMPSPLETQA